ncbi:hypothetical protein [Nocardioides rubriscoriae]|uniref:hypothetical protein n=1 Tax=Nocardioides rubriscoriae TaxID=642762 RepID=UPI0011DF7CEB|nr:hypothetical protein [Nocardioides rubriscoriae]
MRSILLALALALVAGAGVACSDRSGTDDSGTRPVAAVDPLTAAKTSFPGLEPARPGDLPLGLDTASPAPGTVAVVPGPFDDRFVLRGVRLADGVVSGRLTVTSDVSDLLELEVVAGFYDADGRLLTTAKAVHHLDEAVASHEEGPPDETAPFRIAVPRRLLDRVASAAITVPVLVNE